MVADTAHEAGTRRGQSLRSLNGRGRSAATRRTPSVPTRFTCGECGLVASIQELWVCDTAVWLECARCGAVTTIHDAPGDGGPAEAHPAGSGRPTTAAFPAGAVGSA